MDRQINKQTTKIWLLLITALAFGLRLYRLDAQSLWFDEIIIVAIARMSWYQGLLAILGQGIQLTPLFHAIIKLWLAVGDSDWMVRIPAVLLSTLTIPVVFKLGQLYFNNTIGVLTAFIFAINPYQIWYAQEVHLYALLPFIGAGAMYAFGLMLKTKGRYHSVVLLTLFNLIGLPAHYFMFLISTVQFLYLAITFRRTHSLLRRWVLAQVIGVSPLFPWWLLIVWRQHLSVGIGWVPSPQWFAPFLTFWNFTYGYSGEWSMMTIGFLLVAGAGLVLGLCSSGRKSGRGILLALWLFFPPLVTYLMSFGRISFYVDRYLLIISPVMTLLIVSGLIRLRFPVVRWAGITIFVLATGLGLQQIYFDQANFTKENWRTLAQTLDTQATREQIVITCTDGHRLSLQYYNPLQKLRAGDVIFASQVSNIPESKQVAWVVDVQPHLSVHYLSKFLAPVLDTSLLSLEAAGWAKNNLQATLTLSGLNAYQYDITNSAYLPEVVEWYCEN